MENKPSKETIETAHRFWINNRFFHAAGDSEYPSESETFEAGFDHAWSSHVVPLQEQNKALKIDASNWAYQCDLAKRERDKAESENKSLREETERLKAELKINLPEDCVSGYGEIKFCSIRNSDGWRCKKCAD